MALPPRKFLSIIEVAARWGCSAGDIIGWADEGRLEIYASVPLVITDSRILTGLAILCPEDLLGFYRRSPAPGATVTIIRLKATGGGEWLKIVDPRDGLVLGADEVILMREQVETFEDEHELMRPRDARGGSKPKYDWEAMFAYLVRRVYDEGLPKTQAELAREVEAWFMSQTTDNSAPDLRSIQRKLMPIYREPAA